MDGGPDRGSVDAVEDTEGLRAGRAVAKGWDAPGVTDKRLEGADDVADVLDAVEDGRAGGAVAAGAFAAARRDWRVVLLETAAVDSLAERGLVGEAAPTLGGRGLELVAAGFGGAAAALPAAGRGCAMTLTTLSRPTKSPCNGVHWK